MKAQPRKKIHASVEITERTDACHLKFLILCPASPAHELRYRFRPESHWETLSAIPAAHHESRYSEKEENFSGNFSFSYQKTWQCREKNIHFCYAADAGNLFPASAASANTKEYSLGNFISRKTLFGIEKAA